MKKLSPLPLIALIAIVGCASINVLWGSRILDRIHVQPHEELLQSIDRIQRLSTTNQHQQQREQQSRIRRDDSEAESILKKIIHNNETNEDDEQKKENEPDGLASEDNTLASDEKVENHNKFHKYDSPEEFARQCAWTSTSSNAHHRESNCTILARPPEKGGEGISNWIGQIVQGHIVAQQSGCQFLLDYGPGVDIAGVLTPASSSSSNWTVPRGFVCRLNGSKIPCFLASDLGKAEWLATVQKAAGLKVALAYVPTFRHAYTLAASYYTKVNQFRDIMRLLPDFDIYKAMTCSLGSLFKFSENAANYELGLFDQILPTLHAKDTLALSLYIRTGQAEKVPGTMEGLNLMYKKRAESIITCTMNEQQRLLSANSYSRVVWMIITDSQFVKKMVIESHNGTTVSHANSTYPLSIVTTRSRGAHTKTQVSPSTRDFAEALIDWYLIGESDIVVTDNFAPSFGDTATFRTTKPYYKVVKSRGEETCDERIPVYQWN